MSTEMPGPNCPPRSLSALVVWQVVPHDPTDSQALAINRAWTVDPRYLRVSRMERDRVQWGMGRVMGCVANFV